LEFSAFYLNFSRIYSCVSSISSLTNLFTKPYKRTNF